jgi:uncharacterized phage protein (TIGR02218 family)
VTQRQGTELHLKVSRSLAIAYLLRITRQDGFVLRLTSHDRALTHEGETFAPVISGSMSADRREAGLRSGSQELRGLVDGSVVVIPDLLANRYRGAQVEQIMVDWRYPWRVFARDRRWVRNVNWTGSQWVATLEGRTQTLQRASAGRFGGMWGPRCPYTLGDAATCKKDISIGTGFAGAGARVATILKSRGKVTFDTSTWPGSFDDDYFRDGSFTWIWKATDGTGQVTATTTSTTLTDSSQAWATDVHAGKYVRILTGSGAVVSGQAWAGIVSNTATTITYETRAEMSGFVAGTYYDVCQPCENNGVVSPIVYYRHSDRRVELLLPTPFAIAVGDSGIWQAGCNGLLETCRDKFANQLNHGGDPFAPSAAEVIERPGV